jgi:hypothetical protein
MKTAIIEVCKMRSVGGDPSSGVTGVASKGNRTELFGSQTDRRGVEYVRIRSFNTRMVKNCSGKEKRVGQLRRKRDSEMKTNGDGKGGRGMNGPSGGVE